MKMTLSIWLTSIFLLLDGSPLRKYGCTKIPRGGGGGEGGLWWAQGLKDLDIESFKSSWTPDFLSFIFYKHIPQIIAILEEN